MSKIFDIDFRQGSLLEKVNNIAPTKVGTISAISTTNKGMAIRNLSTSSAMAYTGTSTFTNSGSFSVSLAYFHREGANNYGLFGKLTNITGWGIGYTAAGKSLALRVGTGASFTRTTIIGPVFNRWNFLTLVFNSVTNNWSAYINGSTTLTNIVTQAYVANAVAVGLFGIYNSATSSGKGDILFARIYNTILTTDEMLKDYTDFLNSKPQGITKTNFIVSKPTELRENGLIAAYNMIPQKGILYDISGNGRNGTIVGPVSSLNGMQFNGINDVVNLSTYTIGTTYTINFRIKPRVNKNGNVVLGNASSTTNLLVITLTGQVGHRVTGGANITLGNSVLANNWYNITLVRNGTVTVSCYINGIKYSGNLPSNDVYTYRFIGRLNIDYGNHDIQDIRIYNIALPEQQILDYHNQNIRYTLKECWCNNGADGLSTLPKGWTITSGTFKVGENITNEISGRKIGDKYLECITAGLISIPMKTAYGTWEFDMYKGSNSGNIEVGIMASAKQARLGSPSINNGYWALFNSLETFYFQRQSVAGSTGVTDLFNSTTPNYIQLSTWYRVKVTRTVAGLFTVYIKGGLFGNNWVLVTAASGSNPIIDATHTSSNFINLDIDAGDRIGEIEVMDGIKI